VTKAPTTPATTAPTTAAPVATTTKAPAAPISGGDAWAPGVAYRTGDKVTYEGKTYECRQGHSSIRSWEPSIYTLALWLPL
jgi:chitin-binding protein